MGRPPRFEHRGHRWGPPHQGRGRPPWWPEGHDWPQRREGLRRARRVTLTVFVAVVAISVVLGGALGAAVARHGRGPRSVGPALLVLLVGVVALTVAARRLIRPTTELVEAIEGLAERRPVALSAQGPAAMRRLMGAVNTTAERLATDDQRRRDLLADVSHELRTPLSTLRSGLEAQLDGVHPRDDAHLTPLLDHTATLTRLVEDLQTMATSDDGRLHLHLEQVRLGPVVSETVEGFQAMAEPAHVRLVVDQRADPVVEVDTSRVRQVLSNLLVNAVRHSPEASTVTVELDADGTTATVTVSDQGSGFDGDPAVLFERYTTTDRRRGTGIGLAVARLLTEAHGGTISAANQPTGGARFTVLLPISPGR